MSEIRNIVNPHPQQTPDSSAQSQRKQKLEKGKAVARNFKTSVQLAFFKSVLKGQNKDDQPGGAWRKAIAMSIGEFFGPRALQSFQNASKKSESVKSGPAKSGGGIGSSTNSGSTAESGVAVAGGGGGGGGGSGGGFSSGGGGDFGGGGASGDW